MPDLSAYINFAVQLDYTQNKFVLTDNSTYPVGVAAGITGIFSIQQPDMINEEGDWNNPDIEWNGSALPDALRDLRRNSQNKPQKGSYTITYQVDHPDYTPTTLSRTFTLDYTPVTGEITEDFDVFTPDLSVSDEVVYTRPNFTTASITRSWNATVGTVGTVTGTGATLDLAIASYYYDAAYTITLASTVVYNSTAYSFMSVKDVVNSTLSTTANTPPDTCSLLAYLTTIKTRLDELVNTCQPYEQAKANYEYAADLYFHILERLKAGSTSGVIDYVKEFLTIYYNAVPTYVNTNTAILPYTFCYSVSGGGTTDNLTKLHVVLSSNSSTYSSPEFTNSLILMMIKEGLVQKDTDFSLSSDTVSYTNGDTFEAGKWITWLLRKSAGTGSITKLHVLMTADSVSYTNILFANKEILLTITEGGVLKDTDVSLSVTTVSKTNTGDKFFAGTWYTFLLKAI